MSIPEPRATSPEWRGGPPQGYSGLDRLIRRHFERAVLTSRIETGVFRNVREFGRFQADDSEHRRYRAALEDELARRAREGGGFEWPAICRCCKRVSKVRVDLLVSDGQTPNWRERLNCAHCGMSARLRLCLDLCTAILPESRHADLYLTEQRSTAHAWLAERWHVVGSESLGEDLPSGTEVEGLRHENLCALSFSDESFDAIVSFDRLEHVADAGRAFDEFVRVLRPGGTLVLTVPFDVHAARNLQRARVEADGSIVHLEPPDLHVDPLDPERGVLCYWWFGWELLEQLRAAGFRDAAAVSCWSAEAGYLGPVSPVVVAQR